MMNGLSEKELMVMAVAKAVICVMLVGVVLYSGVAGVPLDADLLQWVMLLLSAYFGLSARMYYSSSRGVR